MKKNPDQSLHDYLLNDIFSRIGGVTSRTMFGGYGFYQNGLIFAIIANGRLYFKVGEKNRPDYASMGSKPFVYEMKNHKKTTMNYYELPEEILNEPDELRLWIAKSRAVHDEKPNRKKSCRTLTFI